jgi:hypothetical protein
MVEIAKSLFVRKNPSEKLMAIRMTLQSYFRNSIERTGLRLKEKAGDREIKYGSGTL